MNAPHVCLQARLDHAAAQVSEAYHLCPSWDVLVPALIDGGVDDITQRSVMTPTHIHTHTHHLSVCSVRPIEAHTCTHTHTHTHTHTCRVDNIRRRVCMTHKSGIT